MAEPGRRRLAAAAALLASVAVALCALALVGCGGSDDGDRRTEGVTEDFIDLVDGFKAAAVAGEEFEAIERSRDLEPRETKTVQSFCEILWELDIAGREKPLSNRRFLVSKIRTLAEYRFAHKDSPEVAAALAWLERETELGSFGTAMTRRYLHACAAGRWPRFR